MFQVEGIGGTEPNPVFDESVVDHAEVITDEEAFLMARKMSYMEGILCGINTINLNNKVLMR